MQAARALQASGIPTDVQLIVGIPGDTCDLWRNCFSDLMEWGIHEHYQVFPYHLLPNAPAAEKTFMEEWGISTRMRYVNHMQDGARPRDSVDNLLKSRLVVESKTYTTDDWLRMRTWAAFIKALHHSSLTRLVALYLRFTHQVAYRTFYEQVIEHFFVGQTILYGQLMDHYRQYLEDEEAVDDMQVPQLGGYGRNIDPSRWLQAQICLDIDGVFSALKSFLLANYPSATNLASAIDYQRNVVILPEYDRRVGKSFATDFDWMGYFAAAHNITTDEKRLPEPSSVTDGRIHVTDQACGEPGLFVTALDWEAKQGEARTLTWLLRTIVPRNSIARNNFRVMTLRMGLPS